MVVWYPYYPTVALNAAGTLAQGGAGQIYATTDTTYATPLAVRDITDAPKASVSVSSLGVTEFFKVEDQDEVVWKSGALPAVALMSAGGMRDAAVAAQFAAELAQANAASSQSAAEDAVALALAPTDTAVASVVTTPGSAGRDALDDLYKTVVSVAAYPTPQDALNATPAGGVTYFPPGTYTGDLSVPADVTVHGDGAIINVASTGANAGFILAPGVSNVTIEGFDIRGPWYGLTTSTFVGGGNLATWNATYAENIGIDIRGRWYQRQVLGLTKAAMEALTDVHQRVTVRDCRIEGFGQSGIVADQCTNLRVVNNTIYRCGRDGVRLYGALRARVAGNEIGDLFPAYSDGLAPNFNMYGVTVTRVYGKTGWEDPNLTTGRPSQDVIVAENHVWSCPTWKGLDTHGGRRIRFVDNIVENCFIGVGLDKGGFDAADGIAPARDILISGNLIRSSGATYMRAGVAAYGHDATDAQIFDGLVITGNTFDGWGGNDTDGAISASNVRNLAVTGNTFRDTPRAAVTFVGDVKDFTVTGNVFDNPKGYVTIPVTAGGSGYTSAPTVTVTGGGGTGLKAVARVSAGAVTSVDVLHPGTGYTSAPTVSFSGGGGTGAAATPAFTAGYGVLSGTTNARGVIGANAFTNRDQATVTAVSLQNRAGGYGVKVARDNQYAGTMTRLANAEAEDAGSSSTAARAWANINNTGTAASVSAGRGVASATRTAAGAVTIVLELAASAVNAYAVQVVAKGTTARTYSVNAIDASSFSVRTFDVAGVAVDTGFYMTVQAY